MDLRPPSWSLGAPICHRGDSNAQVRECAFSRTSGSSPARCKAVTRRSACQGKRELPRTGGAGHRSAIALQAGTKEVTGVNPSRLTCRGGRRALDALRRQRVTGKWILRLKEDSGGPEPSFGSGMTTDTRRVSEVCRRFFHRYCHELEQGQCGMQRPRDIHTGAERRCWPP